MDRSCLEIFFFVNKSGTLENLRRQHSVQTFDPDTTRRRPDSLRTFSLSNESSISIFTFRPRRRKTYTSTIPSILGESEKGKKSNVTKNTLV